jgi:small-conductance mechanosensitive channel
MQDLSTSIITIFENLGLTEFQSRFVVSIIAFIGFLVLGWIVDQVFEHYFKRWASKTKTKLDDEILKNVKKPIYILVIFFGIVFSIQTLEIISMFGDFTQGIFEMVFALVSILLIAYIFTRVTNVLFTWYAERRERKTKTSQHILYVLRGVFNAIVYLIAFFVWMAVVEIDLTGLAIGAGATAIVIGFALQHVLSDFFSAFSIYFDKPFEIGDFIIVGDYAGTVKKIGMKSTRVQLLQGEELVLSNKELTTASIRNFKKMRKRRISFSIGVTYDTPLKKLKKVNDIIKSIIDPKKIEHVHSLDRVHFAKFGDFSLSFDIVYYLSTQDYAKYMDTQQEINFNIKEAFKKEGLEITKFCEVYSI